MEGPYHPKIEFGKIADDSNPLLGILGREIARGLLSRNSRRDWQN